MNTLEKFDFSRENEYEVNYMKLLKKYDDLCY